MNPQAPVILIGCGRSGSTLLDRMLNAHPEIHMLGETNFLTDRLWKLLSSSESGSQWTSADKRAYQNRNVFRSIRDNDGGSIASDREWADSEARRLGAIVARTIAELFSIESINKRHWGMKEIWNGGSTIADWAIYDATFPEATWVHIVRHPLSYVRSVIGWRGEESSDSAIREQLALWSRILAKARERSICERYIEIRYEDLVRTPGEALAELFGMLGLQWDARCVYPMRQHWVATKRLPTIDCDYFQQVLKSLGLMEIVGSLGYGGDEQPSQCQTSYSNVIEFDDSGRIVIRDGISKAIGPYWTFALATAPAIRDFLESEEAISSSLIDFSIYEDGQPLSRWGNPANFFRSPAGSFFCNESAVFFTTSDGSDPLTNGRCYSIWPT